MLVTVYGSSKTGKTTFAVSNPGTYLIDLEDGAFAVEGQGAVIRKARTWIELVKSVDDATASKAQVIAIDSMTVAHDLAMQYVTKAQPSLMAIRPSATLQNFGQANELIKQLILQLRAQPQTVVVTAQERTQYVETDGADLGNFSSTKEAVIDLPQGARSFLVMYSDVLGYTHLVQQEDGPEYRLWLQPTPGLVTGVRAKTRAKLPYLPNPTIPRLMRYMGLTTTTK